MKPPCIAHGCEAPSHAKQLCSKHYHRLKTYGDPNAKPALFMNPADAIEARTNRTVPPPAGLVGNCWIWQGSTNGTYGRLGPGLAHRVSYEIAKGQIPSGLDIDHLCRRPLCINPDHLEAVTRRVNLLRSTNFTALEAAQTDCITGHPLSGPNLYMDPRGRRQCRECRRRRNRESKARKRAMNRPGHATYLRGGPNNPTPVQEHTP
ncbi:HNH endonuclease signature motif containing protein [Streptomyces bacillaris]|uniref:HNH endonuclease signature motif containing protein n=1 Tax=Streptomyces bacillaris TaxID=68179 RepID=UPI0035E07DFF